MYNPDYNGVINQGWVCSQCHRSFAPYVSECPYCNAERKTFVSTTTDPQTIKVIPFDDTGWLSWRDWLDKIRAINWRHDYLKEEE